MKSIGLVVGVALVISYFSGTDSHKNRYYEPSLKIDKNRLIPIAIRLPVDEKINRSSAGYSYSYKPSYETGLSDYEKNAIWSEYTPTWTVEQRLRASDGYDP